MRQASIGIEVTIPATVLAEWDMQIQAVRVHRGEYITRVFWLKIHHTRVLAVKVSPYGVKKTRLV
jgi:hypothetical protein